MKKLLTLSIATLASTTVLAPIQAHSQGLVQAIDRELQAQGDWTSTEHRFVDNLEAALSNTWKSLSPATQDRLRAEQRAWARRRDAIVDYGEMVEALRERIRYLVSQGKHEYVRNEQTEVTSAPTPKAAETTVAPTLEPFRMPVPAGPPGALVGGQSNVYMKMGKLPNSGDSVSDSLQDKTLSKDLQFAIWLVREKFNISKMSDREIVADPKLHAAVQEALDSMDRQRKEKEANKRRMSEAVMPPRAERPSADLPDLWIGIHLPQPRITVTAAPEGDHAPRSVVECWLKNSPHMKPGGFGQRVEIEDVRYGKPMIGTTGITLYPVRIVMIVYGAKYAIPQSGPSAGHPATSIDGRANHDLVFYQNTFGDWSVGDFQN